MSNTGGVSKEYLLQELKFWKNKADWWNKADMQAAWIDNGKDGCYNCALETQLAKSKVQLLENLINQCK